ncbi:hypothetical protein JCM10212_005998 [Sporobolomyces blumeae]
MPGPNVRLVLWGLAIGLLSAVYPRLPSYLPYAVSSRLPFVRSTVLDPDLSKTWQSVQRYQHSVPVAPNFDHSREAQWEEEVERQLRFGSKEGGREIDKEMKRVRKKLEKRTQEAGMENLIREGLPVYFVDQDSDAASIATLGSEINGLVPLSVVLIAPYPTTSQHLLVSTAPTLSHPPAQKLSQYLLNSFAHHPPDGVPAVSSSLVALEEEVERTVVVLGLDKVIKMTVIALPVPQEEDESSSGPSEVQGWEKEKWWDVGEVLHELLHDPEGQRTVVVGIGRARPPRAAPSFDSLLEDAFVHHTSHARSLSLSAAYSSSASGQGKPTKRVPKDRVALIVSAEAGGEGEGERVKGGWRFGALPIR